MFACMSGACAEDYADMALAVTQLRAHLGLCAEKGGLTFRLIPLRMMDMVYELEKYGAEGSLVCLFYRGEAIEESKVNSLAALFGEGRWSAEMLGSERGDGMAILYMYLSVPNGWVCPVLSTDTLKNLHPTIQAVYQALMGGFRLQNITFTKLVSQLFSSSFVRVPVGNAESHVRVQHYKHSWFYTDEDLYVSWRTHFGEAADMDA
jgi:hypothetical protein